MFWSCRSALLSLTHSFLLCIDSYWRIYLKLMITTWGINNTVFPRVKVVFVSVHHTDCSISISLACAPTYLPIQSGDRSICCFKCLKRSGLQGSFTHGQTWSGSCSHLLTVDSVYYQFITRTHMDETNSGNLCKFIQHFNTTLYLLVSQRSNWLLALSLTACYS